MINPKELRIGNCIEYYCEYSEWWHYVSVVTLGGDKIYAEGDEIYPPPDYTDYRPIPLTPEILDKCGFKNGRLNIDITAVRPLYLQSGNNGTVVFYWGEYNSQPSPYSIHYEYLHQLQNLYFALTGEELNIEL